MEMKKLLAMLLSFLLSFSSVSSFAAFGLSDGGVDTEESDVQLIDFDNVLTLNKAGAVPVKDYALSGEYSACWTHEKGNSTKNNLYFRELDVTDWSDYSKINISIFGKNTRDVEFGLVIVCSTSLNYIVLTENLDLNAKYTISWNELTMNNGRKASAGSFSNVSGEDENETEPQLIDFDNDVTLSRAGAVPVTEHALSGEYSAYWIHEKGNTTKNNLYFRELDVTDWSDYSKINISIFGKNTRDVEIGLVIVCSTSLNYYWRTTLRGKRFELKLGL